MTRLWRDHLRHKLRQRVEELSEEALAKEEVSGRKMEYVEKLAQLLKLRDAMPPPRGRRWAGLLALLVILSFLLFFHVSCTEVTVDLEVGEVGFTLAQGQGLTEALKLESIGVAGLRQLQLPRTRQRPAETLRAVEGGTMAVRLSAKGDGQDGLTLGSLTPPAGTRCWVVHSEEPNRLRLSLEGEGLALEVGALGRVLLEVPGRGAFELELPIPRSIGLAPAGQALDLDLELAGSPGRMLATQVAVRDLSFLRVEEVSESDRTLVRLLSTVRSGTLYLESLGGREHRLRAGETVRFDASSGWLRSLRLESDHLALDFRGRVRGMTLGAGPSRRTLMPSILEWLRAQQALALLWGAALVAVGLIELVVRWRRIS